MFSEDPVQVSSFWPLISKRGSITRLKCFFGRFSDFKKSNVPEAENIRLHKSRVIRHDRIFKLFFLSLSTEFFSLPMIRFANGTIAYVTGQDSVMRQKCEVSE